MAHERTARRPAGVRIGMGPGGGAAGPAAGDPAGTADGRPSVAVDRRHTVTELGKLKSAS